MDEKQFCYWLQGFFELSNQCYIDEKQTAQIRNHLKLVFDKITQIRDTGYANLYTGPTKPIKPLC
jgi:hypothetical protein